MTKRKNQSDHDQMVEDTVSHLKENKFTNIKADLSGYDQPVKIVWKSSKDGHIPDITAEKSDVEYIFEIETEDTISIEHTEKQWELFAANAKQHDKAFIVVVPKSSEAEAEKQIENMNIEATVWTVS